MRAMLEWRLALVITETIDTSQEKRASLVVLTLRSVRDRIFGHREETQCCLFDPTPSGRNSACA